MTWAIRTVIRIYWLLIPPERRRRCLFRESCSRHVYAQTELGWKVALDAFAARYRACRPGAITLDHCDTDGMALVRLIDGSVVRADQLRR